MPPAGRMVSAESDRDRDRDRGRAMSDLRRPPSSNNVLEEASPMSQEALDALLQKVSNDFAFLRREALRSQPDLGSRQMGHSNSEGPLTSAVFSNWSEMPGSIATGIPSSLFRVANHSSSIDTRKEMSQLSNLSPDRDRRSGITHRSPFEESQSLSLLKEDSSILSSHRSPAQTPGGIDRRLIMSPRFERLPVKKESSGTGWPASLALREEYMETPEVGPGGRSASLRTGRATGTQIRESVSNYYISNADSHTRRNACFGSGAVFHPDSCPMILMELTGVVVVLYELVVTTFMLTFGLVAQGAIELLKFFTFFFFLFDFIVNFNKAFYSSGQLVMVRRKIARHYLKTWLVPDLLLLLLDFVLILLGVVSAAAQDSPILRLFSACRMLKVLRVNRLFRFMDRLMTLALSLGVRFMIQICGFVFVTLLVNHSLCCLWWVVGEHGPTDTGLRWIDLFSTTQQETELFYMYMTALHWTVAQMTLGATEVMPTNSTERMFTVFMLTTALIFGSTLISVISAQLVQYIMLKGSKTGQLTNLRQYLRQEQVPAILSAEVQRQALDRLDDANVLLEDEVFALRLLSRSLRLELVYATRMPLINQHGLFRLWTQMDMKCVKALCQESVTFRFLRAEDDLFLAGDHAEFCYLVVEGRLKYLQRPSFSLVKEDAETSVREGAWLCEAALWCEWHHVGNMTSYSSVKVLCVAPEKIAEISSKHHTVESMTSVYAKNFHSKVTVAIPPFVSWPTDLGVPGTETSDLLSRDVDLDVLAVAIDNGDIELTPAQRTMLEAELREGKCSLSCTSESNEDVLSRVVSLVALRIFNYEKMMFVQVGSQGKNGGVTGSCKLPGSKRRRGELPHQAVRRFVSSKLPTFDDCMEVGDFTQKVETMPSPKYGLNTTYLRAELDAEVDEETALSSVSRWRMDTKQLKDPADLELIADLPHVVYNIPEGGEIQLFAWLTPSQFERLKSPEEKTRLEVWLQLMRMEDAFEENVDARFDSL